MGNTGKMTRINAVLYYELGAAVHPLADFKFWTIIEPHHLKILFYACEKLEKLINLRGSDNSSVFAKKLFDEIEATLKKYTESNDKNKEYSFHDIVTAAQNFENEYKAELLISNTFEINSEGGFDVESLISKPKILFHKDLLKFCPAAAYDLTEIGKCWILNIPISATFHLSRLICIVTHYYLYFLRKKLPNTRIKIVRDYIDELNKEEKADKKIINSLENIFTNYENIIESNLSNIKEEDALSFFGVAQSIVNYIIETIKKGQESTD